MAKRAPNLGTRCFANLSDTEATYTFTKCYEPQNKQLHLYQTTQVDIKALHLISQLATQSDNDRVLVILQLHGGNDGLNSLIPIDDYDTYYSRRANIQTND